MSKSNLFEKSLPETILHSAQSYAAKPAMCTKVDGEWRAVSYQAMQESVRRTARALLTLGVQPGDRIGIFAPNSMEWTLVDLAILSVGAITVPIYATNTQQQLAYVVHDTEMKMIFTGDEQNYAKARAIHAEGSSLNTIITFTADPQAEENIAHRFSQLQARGEDRAGDAELDARLAALETDALATIIYTSGTTGEPKGVMLSHGNLLHQFRALDEQFYVGPGDRSLCFLPLSHVYERTWTFHVLRCGAENCYLADPKAVIDAMAEVKPTVMVSVPRLYEKIYTTALHNLEQGSTFKKKLFTWAIEVGRRYQYQRRAQASISPLPALQHKVADRLVLSKVRAIVGGPKNFFSAGGAPLAQAIEEFFFAAGLLICEGYGLTETSPMVSCNTPQSFKFGTVGKPILDCKVKIGEQGEVLVQGPNVMLGYYKRPEATAEALSEGWFHTGDVGEFDEEGFLRITDRIKDIIITSGGKNIAPQKIQTLYARDHLIEQFVAIGDRRKFVSALIVPNFTALEQYAREQGIAFGSPEELVNNAAIQAEYQQRIRALAGALANYEQVKNFTLLPASFTQESGELTPSQKVNRKVVQERYAAQIEAMYPEE